MKSAIYTLKIQAVALQTKLNFHKGRRVSVESIELIKKQLKEHRDAIKFINSKMGVKWQI